jgi:hypothetical protein
LYYPTIFNILHFLTINTIQYIEDGRTIQYNILKMVEQNNTMYWRW